MFLGHFALGLAAKRAAPQVSLAEWLLSVEFLDLLWPTLLSIVGWGLEGYSLWLIIGGFDVHVPVPLAVFFYATATLAGALIPVPGGLGVSETMLQSQLVQLGGAPQAVATGSMLMIRFSTLWWAVLVGFTALAVLRRRFPSLLRETTGELARRETDLSAS